MTEGHAGGVGRHLAVGLAFPASGATKATAGKLNLIAWEGYTQAQWVKPFEKQTGCKVQREVRRLLGRDGDADALRRRRPVRHGLGLRRRLLRLIYGKDVQPVDPSRIPDFKNFIGAFKSPPNNTVDGKHYGISLQWGPNTLLYNTKLVKPAPTSWARDLQPEVQGQGHRPGQPDPDRRRGALPDEDEAVARDQGSVRAEQGAVQRGDRAAASKQKPLIKKYWALASDEIDLFKNGDAVIGASWPYQTNTLIAAKAPVKDLVPKEGATGWLDTWMLSAKSKNVDCAYKWLAWISTPKVQAQQAVYFGETPVNKLACKRDGQDRQGLVRPVPRERAARRTSSRSTSGRRRSPTAATARRTAWTTRGGSRPGRS